MKSRGWGKGAKGKATQLHSQLVRSRGICERCGRTDKPLQAAHIISRRYSATRTDERNAWALCASCHMRLTEHPDEHVAFAVATLGEDGYEALRAKAREGVRSNEAFWLAEVDRLRTLLAEAA